MASFENNHITFAPSKLIAEDQEISSTLPNSKEDNPKKGLSDLTNILKSSKLSNQLKTRSKNSESNENGRLSLEIASIHYEILNKIRNSNSTFLQKLLQENLQVKGQNSDPLLQINELFKLIVNMSYSRNKSKTQFNELSEEECQNYENLLQKLEAEVRNHIGIQQEMRLLDENVQNRLNDLEKNMGDKKSEPQIEKLKKENSSKRQELKKKQLEIETLSKELAQKSELIKLQSEKLKAFQTNSAHAEKVPQFQNTILERKLEKSQQHIPPKGISSEISQGVFHNINSNSNSNNNNNNNNNNNEVLSRRKTSLSSVSGSNRSLQTHNSLRSGGFEFAAENNKKELMDSSFLKKNLDGLSDKERGIIEYFQSKLNEKDEQVNFLQNQIKSLMNTTRIPEKNDTISEEKENNYNYEINKIKPTREKSSLSSWERNYLATDRIYPRESFAGDQAKNSIVTDRNHFKHNKNASFHNNNNNNEGVLKNSNKSYLKEETQKSHKDLLHEKEFGKNMQFLNNASKNSFLESKNLKNNDDDEELNSKYFLKVSKNKSPLKHDYKNFECNILKKSDLSHMSKAENKTQRVSNENLNHNAKNFDGKKGSYAEFLNKNRSYLYQEDK